MKKIIVVGMFLASVVFTGCRRSNENMLPTATSVPPGKTISSSTPELFPLVNEWLFSYLKATPPANTGGLTLALSLDKTVYHQSEKIISTIILKNEGSRVVQIDLTPLWPLKYETPGLFPSYCGRPGYQAIGYLMKTPSGGDASDLSIVDYWWPIDTEALQQLAPGESVTIVDPCVGDGVLRSEHGQYRIQAVYQNRFSATSDQEVLIIWSNIITFTSEPDE